MNSSNVQYSSMQNQDISADEQFVCPMCEGSHGNNSQCQRND